MKKFYFFLIILAAIILTSGFANAELFELRAGPERAWTCGQTVSDSLTFSDEPSRLLWSISAGGSVGADDVAFFYKDGSLIEAAGGPDCAGFTSPSDIKCNKACSGTENIPWQIYFSDSGAGSPDSVTMSGTAYETYQPTELVTDVAFNGWQISVFWNDCSAGQRADNGSCIPITGSITPDKTSCTAPCDVNLTWDTNSYQTAMITKNGSVIATPTTDSGVSNTDTSGGPIPDNALVAGTYNYCIEGNDGFGNSTGNLDCKTVTVTNAALPTADLTVNGETDDDITITAGGNASYDWTSTNATSGSSTLTISPSSPDSCGNANSSNWVISGTSGSTSGATCSTAGGYTYTITYTVTGPGGSASNTVIIRLSSPPPPPTLSVTLSANPSSGTDPLSSTLSADVSGTATGTINYSFWWNCTNTSNSVSTVSTSCGSLPAPASGSCSGNSIGYKCNGVNTDPQLTSSHAYTPAGTYTGKVIAERGAATPAEARATINVSEPGAPTLSVTLTTATDSSSWGNILIGTAPLNGVDLRAIVEGTAAGSITYTWYCNRVDTGTNVTTPFDAQDANAVTTSLIKDNICDYSSVGTYTPKIIVQREGLTAQGQVPVIVSSSPSPSPSPTALIQCNDQPLPADCIINEDENIEFINNSTP